MNRYCTNVSRTTFRIASAHLNDTGGGDKVAATPPNYSSSCVVAPFWGSIAYTGSPPSVFSMADVHHDCNRNGYPDSVCHCIKRVKHSPHILKVLDNFDGDSEEYSERNNRNCSPRSRIGGCAKPKNSEYSE